MEPGALRDIELGLGTPPKADLLDMIARDIGVGSAAKMFREGLTDLQTGYVCTCLLRAMEQQLTLTRNAGLRSQAWGFLDENLARTYDRYSINPSDQTYKKERSLKKVLSGLVSKLEGTAHGMSVTSLSRVREDVLKTLNSEMWKPMSYFLFDSSLLHDVRLLLDEAVRYGSAELRDLAGLHREIVRLGGRLMERSAEFPDLAQISLLSLARSAVELINQHFQQSAASRPAALSIELVPKRYPLMEAGSAFDLLVHVTNDGPGAAFDVEIEIGDLVGGVEILDRHLAVGDLAEGAIALQIPCRVSDPEEALLIQGTFRWGASSGTQEDRFDLDVPAQPAGVPWAEIEGWEPYSLEPAIGRGSLVGRTDILDSMLGRLTGLSVGSFWLWGQRRVGKTSVAKTIQSQLAELPSPKTLVVYAEAGDYVVPDAEGTIQRLGQFLCEEIIDSSPAFGGIPIPEFKEGLSPLTSFLRQVSLVAPELRIVFILDEFDRLPPRLYQKGILSQALFLTIRSISGKAQYGFVLVGGETMDLIMSVQGQELNKFQVARLDHFDRESHFADFAELVRAPLEPWFDFDESSLLALHDLSAGNPYFTKLIGQELFGLMVKRRDLSVTRKEIREAGALAVRRIGANSFQHFWDDRILVPGTEEDLSIARRRLLAALSHCPLDGAHRVDRDALFGAAGRFGLEVTQAKETLEEFVSRRVLQVSGDKVSAVVDLFGSWLHEKGVAELLVGLPELTRWQQETLDAAPAAVQSGEIVEVVAAWPAYMGRPVTAEDVRAWLDQFGPVEEQRLVFKLLPHLRFYSPDLIRQRLREGHGVVRRGLKQVLEEGKSKRSDILVSFFGEVGKSSAKIARHYADEVGIYTANVVAMDQIEGRLVPSDLVSTVVLLDDFVGTGGTLSGHLQDNQDMLRRVAENARVVLMALCATNEGAVKVEAMIDQLGCPVEFHAVDQLGPEARCLSESARVFGPDERDVAERILSHWGALLVKKHPLGFGNGQLLVVFDDTIPNNSLPILWQERKGFRPLFRRPK